MFLDFATTFNRPTGLACVDTIGTLLAVNGNSKLSSSTGRSRGAVGSQSVYCCLLVTKHFATASGATSYGGRYVLGRFLLKERRRMAITRKRRWYDNLFFEFYLQIPLLTIQTRLFRESVERRIYDIGRLRINLWKWQWEIHLYKRPSV